MQIDKISISNVSYKKTQSKKNENNDAFKTDLSKKCDQISIKHRVNAAGETGYDEYAQARIQKVSNLKTQIESGEYEVDSLDVAKCIIAKSRINKVI